MQTSFPTTCWLVFQNDHLLFIKHKTHFTLPTTQNNMPTFLREIQLGMFNDQLCYCAEIASDASLPVQYELIPLRKSFELLEPIWYSLVVKAYSVINWDKNHQYCGRCGHITSHQSHIFERLCEHCGLAVYPRISPSVIVLIQKGDELLMARSPHFTKGVYGLIAGFVEAGESIEEAIHREVREEVNINIQNLHYFGSQPWPFPDSLMIGFTAEYASGELMIDNNEIEEAGWYRYDNLPGRPSSNISIAGKLINYFIEKKQQQYH